MVNYSRIVITLVRTALVAGSTILSVGAHARCSIRVADPLITQRFQECNPKKLLSYLYNDLVTPFSFTCAKKLAATCHHANCEKPKSEEDETRCYSQYVEVLNECAPQIADAARMARCKDTQAWPISPPNARAPAAGTPPTTEASPAPLSPDLAPPTSG